MATYDSAAHMVVLDQTGNPVTGSPFALGYDTTDNHLDDYPYAGTTQFSQTVMPGLGGGFHPVPSQLPLTDGRNIVPRWLGPNNQILCWDSLTHETLWTIDGGRKGAASSQFDVNQPLMIAGNLLLTFSQRCSGNATSVQSYNTLSADFPANTNNGNNTDDPLGVPYSLTDNSSLNTWADTSMAHLVTSIVITNGLAWLPSSQFYQLRAFDMADGTEHIVDGPQNTPGPLYAPQGSPQQVAISNDWQVMSGSSLANPYPYANYTDFTTKAYSSVRIVTMTTYPTVPFDTSLDAALGCAADEHVLYQFGIGSVSSSNLFISSGFGYGSVYQAAFFTGGNLSIADSDGNVDANMYTSATPFYSWAASGPVGTFPDAQIIRCCFVIGQLAQFDWQAQLPPPYDFTRGTYAPQVVQGDGSISDIVFFTPADSVPGSNGLPQCAAYRLDTMQVAWYEDLYPPESLPNPVSWTCSNPIAADGSFGFLMTWTDADSHTYSFWYQLAFYNGFSTTIQNLETPGGYGDTPPPVVHTRGYNPLIAAGDSQWYLGTDGIHELA